MYTYRIIILDIDQNFDKVKENLKILKEIMYKNIANIDHSLLSDIYDYISKAMSARLGNSMPEFGIDTTFKRKLVVCLNNLNQSVYKFRISLDTLRFNFEVDSGNTERYQSIYNAYLEVFDTYRSTICDSFVVISDYLSSQEGLSK